MSKLELTNNEYLMYQTHTSKTKKPGILFLSGFRADMQGTKAMGFMEFAQANDFSYTCFDYRGHGESSTEFPKCTLQTWLEDAISILDHVTQGPQIVVGSSMGGWLMLHLAQLRPDRIQGLVGIGAAPDFTEEILMEQYTPQERFEMETNGFVVQPSNYESPYIFTWDLIQSGRDLSIFNKPYVLNKPVHLFHGLQDDVVSVNTAQKLFMHMDSPDITLTIVKDGEHTLSRPQDIDKIIGGVMGMV